MILIHFILSSRKQRLIFETFFLSLIGTKKKYLLRITNVIASQVHDSIIAIKNIDFTNTYKENKYIFSLYMNLVGKSSECVERFDFGFCRHYNNLKAKCNQISFKFYVCNS
jgi:hypothetical protein